MFALISNYKDFISFCKSLDKRPRLLLHSCCGPCSSWTMKLLSEYFDLDIFYSNDNIYPKEEYLKRLSEQERIAQMLVPSAKVFYDDYNDLDYYAAIKGYETLGEHSKRCYLCMLLRMRKTAKRAKELGYDYFTTTLSISPHKNSDWINEIGYMLENEVGVKYLYSNFKKDEGYKHSIELSKEYDLYRQDYCGCVYSLNERNASK